MAWGWLRRIVERIAWFRVKGCKLVTTAPTAFSVTHCHLRISLEPVRQSSRQTTRGCYMLAVRGKSGQLSRLRFPFLLVSSIDGSVDRASGQVVEPRGISRSSGPLVNALLTVLRARSAETTARSAAEAAVKQRPGTVSRREGWPSQEY